MSAAATSKESAAFCADLVRTHDFPRYAATLFLPGGIKTKLVRLVTGRGRRLKAS